MNVIGYMFVVPTILTTIDRIPGIEQRTIPDLKCMMVADDMVISGGFSIHPGRVGKCHR